MADHDVPQYNDLLWPTLIAVSERGGSASIDEIAESVVKNQSFSVAQQAVLHGDGPQTEIEYRLAWARTYLKGMGLLINSTRGVWALTESGMQLMTDPAQSDAAKRRKVRELHAAYAVELRKAQRQKQLERQASQPDESSPEPAEGSSHQWKDELLDALMGMSPDGFERLTQRLLREAGFISATVTGRSGDGGIDGLGVYRLSLVSFPVFYQCKRYRGSVGAGAVRDFRGAMAGRGDKGLLITTGTFTADAKAEATRDGAPPVDLIEGERLCDLLKQYELGVQTTVRQVEDVAVNRSFFADV
jgi:restriction system protein